MKPASFLVLLSLCCAAPGQAQPAADDAAARKANKARLAQYDVWQREAAKKHKVDWLLAKAVRVKESFNKPNYVSTTGAVGLMQLMPFGAGKMLRTRNYDNFMAARRSKTRRHRGKHHTHWAAVYRLDLQRLHQKLPHQKLIKVDQRFDPRWNIDRGTAFLARLMRRFKRLYKRASKRDRLTMTLAAYYAGPGRVKYRKGKVVLPKYRTKHYVADALKVYDRLKAGLPGR